MDLSPLSFMTDFVHPFIAGGAVNISAPLDAHHLQHLLEALSDATDSQSPLCQIKDTVRRARKMIAVTLWPYPLKLELDEDSIRILLVIYNTLFLSHPMIHRWWGQSRGLERVAEFTLNSLNIEPPQSEADLVNRHTLISRLEQLVREDVQIRFWTGRRVYYGMRPPERLLVWKRLRRVRMEKMLVNWLATDLIPAQAKLLERLLLQSPLTDLFTLPRPRPAFSWKHLLSFLENPRIGRMVSFHYQRLGVQHVGPQLSKTFWQLMKNTPSLIDRRHAAGILCGLIAHMLACDALGPVAMLDIAHGSSFSPKLIELSCSAEHSFADRSILTIGASVEADVVIKHPAVSDLHAEVLRLDTGDLLIQVKNVDLHFFLNGRQSQKAILKCGDLIELGDAFFQYSDGKLSLEKEVLESKNLEQDPTANLDSVLIAGLGCELFPPQLMQDFPGLEENFRRLLLKAGARLGAHAARSIQELRKMLEVPNAA